MAVRVAHPGWGPARIRWQLEREDVEPLPGRSAVYRALLRHGLVEAPKRRRRRADYRRWERSRSMELWQMDVVGRVILADGTEVKVVTGIDDHSRFVVCATVVARATARPVCEALRRRWPARGAGADPDGQREGVHRAVRAGAGAGVVRPDLRRERGPAPVDRAVFADHHRKDRAVPQDDARRMRHRHERRFATLAERRPRWTGGSSEYNTVRPHQSLGGRRPRSGSLWRRAVTLSTRRRPRPVTGARRHSAAGRRPAGVSRWVDQRGSDQPGRVQLSGRADVRRRACRGRRDRWAGRDPARRGAGRHARAAGQAGPAGPFEPPGFRCSGAPGNPPKG